MTHPFVVPERPQPTRLLSKSILEASRVLMVEDELLIAEEVRAALEGFGF